MRTTLRNTALAAVAAMALVAGGTGSAMAAWGGHGGGGHFGGGHFGGYHGGFHGGHGYYGGGFGPGFVGGLALGAFAAGPYYGYYDAPYGYAYDDGPDCYLTRRVFIDRWGRRIVRHVQVCD